MRVHLKEASADYEDGYNHGAAAAFGIIGMFEAIALNAPLQDRCKTCGYEPARGPHPSDSYDECLYRLVDGSTRCGKCADESGLADEPTPSPRVPNEDGNG